MNIATKRVNGAVAIKITLDKMYQRYLKKKQALELDLRRLKEGMNNEELNDYLKRIQ